MRIEMAMTRDENKFAVNSWWGGSAEFVLRALSSQLDAAKVIFPELNDYDIGKVSVEAKPGTKP